MHAVHAGHGRVKVDVNLAVTTQEPSPSQRSVWTAHGCTETPPSTPSTPSSRSSISTTPSSVSDSTLYPDSSPTAYINRLSLSSTSSTPCSTDLIKTSTPKNSAIVHQSSPTSATSDSILTVGDFTYIKKRCLKRKLSATFDTLDLDVTKFQSWNDTPRTPPCFNNDTQSSIQSIYSNRLNPDSFALSPFVYPPTPTKKPVLTRYFTLLIPRRLF